MLRTLVEQGKALELNTCRGKSVEDYRDLFTWYWEEGGELLTLGSDAHDPAQIGWGIPEGQELLRQLGFRWYGVYRERKPIMMKL
jgi:histidinol-phosphatase (PHP family)